MSAYAQLTDHFARISHLHGALGVLHWDMAAMMPSGGAAERSDQMATLKVITHQLTTDPRLKDWLDAAEAQGGLDDWQQANVREMRRAWQHANAVPERLVSALSKAGSACEMTWRTARGDNDWARLEPLLTEVIGLVRETAQAKSEALGLGLYDAMLDEYEPDGRSADIDVLFDDLAGFLPEFTQQVIDHQARQPAIIQPKGPFPIAAQRAVGVQFMGALGFDFDHGRLDVSHHPFCGGSATDVRITTRYDEADFTSALMGVIHETGHALYEQGRPAAYLHQPVGLARGMSVHESQSLLMEMQACRSKQFLNYAAPILKAGFNGEGPAWGTDNLYGLYTQVQRSLIRVDADEVTYPAHVILRYRLERALLSGELAVKDLPEAWNAAMVELLGIKPPSDRDGCMQDIHWMDGTVGYFPTYTMGAMTAAQLFDAATTADAGILPGISQGDFAPLLAWLRTHVHSQVSKLSTSDLLTAATGRPLDASVFKAHLQRRYLG